MFYRRPDRPGRNPRVCTCLTAEPPSTALLVRRLAHITTDDTSAFERLPPGPHRLSANEVARHQRERTCAALLEAIVRNGYDATTIGQLTARAGISRRTFYEHFTNKDACLSGVVDGIGTELAATVRSATPVSRQRNPDPLRLALRRLATLFTDPHRAAALGVAASSHASTVEGMHELQGHLEQALVQLLRRTSEHPAPPLLLKAVAAGIQYAFLVRLPPHGSNSFAGVADALANHVRDLDSPVLTRLVATARSPREEPTVADTREQRTTRPATRWATTGEMATVDVRDTMLRAAITSRATTLSPTFAVRESVESLARYVAATRAFAGDEPSVFGVGATGAEHNRRLAQGLAEVITEPLPQPDPCNVLRDFTAGTIWRFLHSAPANSRTHTSHVADQLAFAVLAPRIGADAAEAVLLASRTDPGGAQAPDDVCGQP